MSTATNEEKMANPAREAMMLKSLRPVSFGMASLFVLFAVAHKMFLPPGVAPLMLLVASTTAVSLFGLYYWLRRRGAPPRWSHRLGAAIAGGTLFNSLLHLYLLSEPHQSTNVAVVMIGAGCFFLSARWLTLVLLAGLSGWAAVAVSIGHSPDWLHFGFLMLSASVLSIMIYVVRVRTMGQLESMRQYHDLFQLANDAILIFNPADEIVLDVNDKACKTYGISRDAFVGMCLKDISQDNTRSEGYLKRLLAEGTSQEFETVQFRADGTPIYFLINASVIEYHGHPAVLSINRDITDRKRAEEALRESEEHLRQSQKMEAVGRLAGGVAHDFNNLLTAITGYSDLSLRQLAPGDRLRSHLAEIKKASGRAADLTRQLLAFSRKQVLQPKVINLNAAVADMHKLLRRLIGEDIELVTACKSSAAVIYADPGQIQQVIMNLAVNARDAMPQGGKLIIETSNIELSKQYTQQHTAVPPGQYVLLAMSDTGCGMDAETQRRIFEPFFTTKAMGKGTGLGLSTVYGIVKQSGGHIWVYSEIEYGTTFKIYLPRVQEPAESEEAQEADSKLLRGSETVLLVEDEEVVRHMARKSLELCGYHVLEAEGGVEALTLCETHEAEIQLLLTDVVMPQMSGRELAEGLKKLRPEIKTLYMSGYTDDSIIHHGVLGPDAAFLEKPFTPDDLARKMREVLDTAPASSRY